MKKKRLLPILLVLIAALAVMSLAACVRKKDGNGGGSGTGGGEGENPPPPPHVHTFSDEWTFNDEFHWHAATCGDTTEVKDRAAHVMDGLECKVCDYSIAPSVLKYEEISGGYKVIGWGDNVADEDKASLVIPDKYKNPDKYENTPVTEIAESAFENDTNIKTIRFPKHLNTIGDTAFAGCTALTSVKLENVETMGNEVFTGCSLLERAELRNVKTIGFATFYLCDKLEYALIDGTTSLDTQTFQECSALAEVELGDGLTTIDEYIFYKCEALKKLTLGKDFAADGSTQFSAHADSLESITVVPENGTFCSENGVVYNKDKTELVVVPLGYKGKLTLHEGVTEIDDDTLAVAYHEYITSLVIPASVTNIETNGPFNGCSRLAEIVNLCEVEIQAGKLGLKDDVSVIDSLAAAKTTDPDEDGYVWYEDETPILVAYFGDETELTLPVSHNGKDYVIRQYAFYSMPLTSVTSTGGVKEIGDYAFGSAYAYGYPNNTRSVLTTVNFGDGLEKIGQFAFTYCANLYDVTLPKTLVEIATKAFGNNCNSLTSLKFMGNLSDWAKVAYWDTTVNRKSVLLNGTDPITGKIVIENVPTVGQCAFYGTDITMVVIGSGVETLDSTAFGKCPNLSTVVLGPDVNYFSDAFRTVGNNDKTAVSKIYYKGTASGFRALNYGRGNDAPGARDATIYYYEESDPSGKAGNFWHGDVSDPIEW